MASSRQYRYTPLQHSRQFRLLRLQPGDEAASTQITIFPVSLDELPTYEALSYTWGNPSQKAKICCNEDGCAIEITQNCEAALRRLREKDKDRLLWIDAICIDQSNIGERNQQVRLMSAIYQQAQRVLAYLGEASDDSDLGMDFVLEDAVSIHRTGRPSVGLSPDISSSPLQKAIDRILERPYFERIWILQEIVFAKEVLIVLGDRSVDWRAFSAAVYYVNKNKQLHLGPRYRGKPPRAVFYRDESTKWSNHQKSNTDKPDSLLSFLKDTRHCKSSDARDKIYALLGMTLEKNDFFPDYSVSIRDTFILLTKSFITRDKNLDVLCHVQGARSPHNLPSWVPDWSYPRLADVLGHEKTLSIRPYKANGASIANVNFGRDQYFLLHDLQNLIKNPEMLMDSLGHQLQDPEILVAKGILVDKVDQVGLMYSINDEINISTLRQWEYMAKSLPRNPTEADTHLAFVNTLIAYPAYDKPSVFARFYPAWHTTTFGDQAPDASAAIFQDQLNKVCHGRCFFVTDKGHMGLGPPEMGKGDLVAVLLGGSVPFILREEGQEQYTLVGESYVYGFMNGEALGSPETKMCMFHIK
jgi:hypothetical protein